MALVFYAGHGLQIKGENYLPTVDADINSEEDVPNQSISMRQLMDVLDEAKTRLNLVFLDACRNNPYARSFRSSDQGLARISAPSGTLISYATRPGSVAADGSGRNGLYTGELLRQMQQTQAPIEQVLKRVVSSVKSGSQGKQEPWMEGSIEGDFCFGDCALGVQIASGSPAPAPAPTANISTSHKLTVGQVFKDCADCPEMVVIPAGSFEMGSNNGSDNEKPVHSVRIASFAMGTTEVTQAQWRAVMGSNPSNFKSCGAECPVEHASWDKAQEFIKRLNAKTGKTYRLPSEAEWEYACRAGGRHEYCGSDDINRVAWHGDNSDKKPHPVKRKQANAWGLFDMSGNVWEWVQDCYNDNDNYNYNYNYNDAPTDGSAWQSGNCPVRVLRGGSWAFWPELTRAASRFGDSPVDRNDDAGGLRLAMMLP